MLAVLNQPAVFLPTVLLLLLAASFGGLAIRRIDARLLGPDHRSDLNAIQASVLGLLGLLLGFSFSMAVSRYDTRKQLEIDEANAIGTTWLRTSTLDDPARSSARDLLRNYIHVRSTFVTDAAPDAAADTAQRTAQLQSELWTVASGAANQHPDPIHALFLSTLNDTIDLSERRTAALENRIPGMAWIMLVFMASVASFLTGLSLTSRARLLLAILPIVVGAALTLILDLDTARSGFVTVEQQSILRLRQQIDATPR